MKQRTWPPSAGFSSGSCSWHVVRACGQRSTNLQPGGSAERLGTLPGDRGERLPPAPVRRDRREQRLRVRMPGALEDRHHVALLDRAPGVHDDDAVADLRDHAEIVRDEDDRGPVRLPESLQELDDLSLERHVERRGRLVGDEQRGLEHERGRDHDPLPHPAGELVRVVAQAILDVGDADLLEQLHRPPPQRFAARPSSTLVRFLDVDHLRPDGERRVQARQRILEDHHELRPSQPAHLLGAQRRGGPGP